MLTRALCTLALAALTLAFTATAGAQFNAAGLPGVTKLTNPQPVENDGKIEVIEFFGYGCIHCAQLEAALEAWIKRQPADVRVKRVPVPTAFRGVPSIPIFYSLEAMGVLDRLHPKIFEAIHAENVTLGNPSTLHAWLVKNGVDPKKFEEVQKSFSVVNKGNRAAKMSHEYEAGSTPAMVVNGRYMVQGGADVMFSSVDRLIADARAANKAAAPAKAPPAKK